MKSTKIIIRAVESRSHFVAEIKKQLPDAIIHWDKSGCPMRSFLKACEIAGDDAVLMLEDDIILTDNFREKAEVVIAENPDILINFFSLSKKYTETHYKAGKEFCMCQCNYLPAGFAKRCIDTYSEWRSTERGKKYRLATDFLKGYAWGYSKKYLVYCPSLVQHREVVSVTDKRRSSKRQSITFQQ